MSPENKLLIVMGICITLFLVFVVGTYYEFIRITNNDKPSEELARLSVYLKKQKANKEKSLRNQTYQKGIRPSQWN